MVLLERKLAESWNVLCLSAPYMLFGFFVAGLLKAFIPDDFSPATWARRAAPTW